MQLDRRGQPPAPANERFGKNKQAAMLPAAAFPMTSFAMQGAAMIWDMQVQTARHLWRTQARAAAMLGFPDYSALFDASGSDSRDVVRATAPTVRTDARARSATARHVPPHADLVAEREARAIASGEPQIGDLVQEAERMQDIPQVIARVIDGPAEAHVQENVSAANAEVQHDDVVRETVETSVSEARPAARDEESAPRREKNGKRGGRKVSPK